MKRECDGTWLCVVIGLIIFALSSYGLWKFCLLLFEQINYAGFSLGGR